MPSDDPKKKLDSFISGNRLGQTKVIKNERNEKTIKSLTNHLNSLTNIFEMALNGYTYDKEKQVVEFTIDVQHIRPLSRFEVEMIRLITHRYGISVISELINKVVEYKHKVIFTMKETDAS